MIVIDASVLAPALADDGNDGNVARLRIAGEELAAPELIDLEVLSVWRRQVAAGLLETGRAASAIRDLHEMPLRRSTHRPLIARCWQLRGNLSVYDASYVTLAELLGVRLLTADTRLGATPDIACEIELIESRP